MVGFRDLLGVSAPRFGKIGSQMSSSPVGSTNETLVPASTVCTIEPDMI
jgi:hypothetical protein